MSNFLENYELEGELLKIFIFPAPILTKKTENITEFDEEFKNLCKNMIFTMYKSPGIGLAAPQVGIGKRFFVMDVEYSREEFTNDDGETDYKLSDFSPMVIVNPKIVNADGEILYEEGCLSLPGVYEEVKRKKNITLQYQDINGEDQEIDADELFSVCIQHEMDHLDGIVFLDRLSLLKRNLYKKKFIKKAKK